MALRSLLLDRGIELPQASDTAVRVIDVSAPGRDRDRVRDNRCRLRTVEAARGIPSTLCPEIKGKPSIIGDQTIRFALLAERRKDRDGVISWVDPLRVSPKQKVK